MTRNPALMRPERGLGRSRAGPNGSKGHGGRDSRRAPEEPIRQQAVLLRLLGRPGRHGTEEARTRRDRSLIRKTSSYPRPRQRPPSCRRKRRHPMSRKAEPRTGAPATRRGGCCQSWSMCWYHRRRPHPGTVRQPSQAPGVNLL